MAITDKQLLEIKGIIQEFIDNNAYKRKEGHVQQDYIAPLLEILGWNKKNCLIQQKAEYTNKIPDMALIGSGGGVIFILESKEPMVHNGLDGKYPNWTFEEQLCSYCNGEGVSWGVLTNFLEWRIYNPHSFSMNGTFYKNLIILENNKIICSDEDLISFFSLIDYAFLNSRKGKISKDNIYYKKEEIIKEEFFLNLKKWRVNLRNYIYKNYHFLSTIQVDYYTQKILDRLIFMDVCFDKGIISQDILGSVLFSGKPYYTELKRKFRDFDDKYNSELFKREECDNFEIPNTVIEDIIKGINHTDFTNLSVHIIGEVYENYLGELLKEGKKTILKTNESKEHLKRQTQGIYYTPDYIVNYIVENTIGELLKKCKTVSDIEKIKVLDASCGSGSFLIGAFDIFYKAYRNKIVKDEEQLDIFNELEIRKKILLHNLYGIDLDERAVEITKLNLLLRGLEGLQDLDTNMKERKILPNLSLNICCGNSLISAINDNEEAETNEDEQLSFIFNEDYEHIENIKKLFELKKEFYNEEDNNKKDKIINNIRSHELIINKYLNKSLNKIFKDTEKIKPINYEVSFCEVMNNGGFDCIIGNPPYVNNEKISNYEKDYYKKTYIVSKRQINLFSLFVESSFKRLKTNGRFGFIIPSLFIKAPNHKYLREFINENTSSFNLIERGDKVFKNVKMPTCTVILQKGKNDTDYFISSAEKYFTKRKFVRLGDKNISIIRRGLEIGKDKLKETGYKICITGDDIDVFCIKSKKYISEQIFKNFKKNEKIFLLPKILVRETGYKFFSTIDTENLLTTRSIYNIRLIDKMYSEYFILSILNSALFQYYFKEFISPKTNIYPKIRIVQLKQIPIPVLDFTNERDKNNYNNLIELTNEMLKLNKYPEKNKIRIDATNIEIDLLIFKLYNITKEEQDIIEKALEKK